MIIVAFIHFLFSIFARAVLVPIAYIVLVYIAFKVVVFIAKNII